MGTLDPDGARISVRRRFFWTAVGIMVPLALYLPNLLTPFTFQDDHQLFYLAGRTSDSLHRPITVAEAIKGDRAKGRFRPLHIAERVWISQKVDMGPGVLRMVPLAALAITTAALLGLGRALGLSQWASIMMAWLVVLNPRGKEIWYMLAPAEHVGLPLACLAVFAVVRGARANRRRWLWDPLTVVLAALSGCAKESFFLAVPAIAIMRIAAEIHLSDRSWRDAIRRNLLLIIALVGLSMGGLALAASAVSPDTYSADLIAKSSVWKGLKRVFKHVASTNAYFAPVLVYLGVVVSGRAGRDRRRGRVAIAVTAGLLAWLIPTAALQVMVGSAPGRWIFPLTVAVAMGNALALAWLEFRAKPSLRRILYAVVAVWLVYCGAKGVSGLLEFRANALTADATVRTLCENVPRGGRVLIVADAWKMRELPLSLRRHCQFAGRGDIAMEVLDTSPETAALSADQLRMRIQRERVPRAAVGERLEVFDAVMFMPPWEMMPNAIQDKVAPTFSAVTVGRKSRWDKQAAGAVYLRKRPTSMSAE